jgi:tetratricopeptide (TPR) repeat protein
MGYMSGLTLLMALLSLPLPSANVDEALDEFEDGNYLRAAILLDDFARTEPDQYHSNNLHYLRGRIAETQQDWQKAEREFNQVGAESVLYDLAVWHLAKVALLDGRPADARQVLRWLPSDFPPQLKTELAELAPTEVALEIYDTLSTRDARLESALIREDVDALWRLLRERSNDDIAVRAARAVYDLALEPEDRLFLAQTYASHRAFDLAEPMYLSLLEDPEYAADAHYGLGRIYFQLTRYDEALGLYRSTILQFPETDQAEQAELQIPPTYWRKLDFATAAAAYVDLIDKYRSDRRRFQSSVRDLVDIYRSLGDNDAALSWIEEGLSNRPSRSDRAVLTFTRGKIEYLEGEYEAALTSFRQVQGLDLRAVPNGTDLEEARFFEALSLEKLERIDEARSIWSRLAESPFSYYGFKSARALGDSETLGYHISQTVDVSLGLPGGQLCRRPAERTTRELVRARRMEETRELALDRVETNRVGELAFLHLWDEAFFWADQQAARYDDQSLADLAYLAGDYRRAMLHAQRLRRGPLDAFFEPDAINTVDTETLLGMLYPAGFADFICQESLAARANPLWLRSIIWQESRYDPGARSGAVARGLMQFIPETALDIATQVGITDLELTRSLYDPAVSIALGAHYWSYLTDEFPEPEMALAAYNGGPHNVQRWRAKSPTGNGDGIFLSDIGFVETKDYVRRIFELYARYAYLQREVILAE